MDKKRRKMEGEKRKRPCEMADQNHNHVAVQIKEMLAKAEPPFTTECCIYKVPQQIRKLNEDAYTPKLVSIGPFHYGNPGLRIMESYKKIYCKKFIERAETSLDNLVSCVQDLEPLVRRCYSEKIELSTDEFVKLILVDCGFIFELSLSLDGRTSFETWLEWHIWSDLILLENQLPFFILEELYNLAFPSGFEGKSIIDLTLDYFGFNIKQDSDFRPGPGTDSNLDPDMSVDLNRGHHAIVNGKHFTDMLRTSYLHPPNKRPAREDIDSLSQLIYSASELNEAGVMFKSNTESQCLLDLRSSGHYLEIPHLSVYDNTEIQFRNMIALEQCHYMKESFVTDYIATLDFLINTEKDVEVLVKNGIITNGLGNNSDVTKLFNGLFKNIWWANRNSDYIRIYDNLNAYYKHPWNSIKATLRRDYCSTPWQAVASFAGMVLLILTVVQTICSIRQIM